MPPGSGEPALSLREGDGGRQHLLQELDQKQDFYTSPSVPPCHMESDYFQFVKNYCSFTHTHTHTRPCEDGGNDLSHAITTKECLRLPEAGRCKEMPSPRSYCRSMTQLATCVELVGSRTVKEYIFVVLSHSVYIFTTAARSS